MSRTIPHKEASRRGGLARAKVLTAIERSRSARQASRARWGPPKVSAMQKFLRELAGLYCEQFAEVPEVLPGLIEPLVLWDYELQVAEVRSQLKREKGALTDANL